MPSVDKLRVVIDTNLLVSAIIIANSLPDQLLRLWQNDLFVLIVSNETLEEIKDVLQRKHIKNKYHLSLEKITELVTTLRLAAELANPLLEEDLPIHCRDRKDDVLLALALDADADYLITGDEDLLLLNGKKELGKLKITTAKEFLNSCRSGATHNS